MEKIIVNISIIWTQLFQLCKKERARWPQTEISTRPLCMSPLLSGTTFRFYLSVTCSVFLTPCALNLSQTMRAARSHCSLLSNGTCSTASPCQPAVGSLPWAFTISKSDISSGTVTCFVQWVNFIYGGKKKPTYTAPLPGWSCQSQNKSPNKGLSKLLSWLQSTTAILLSRMWGEKQQNAIRGLPAPCAESQK